MSAYPPELYDDVVQVQHEAPDSFGSGRLIGHNLVLTARHVVRPGGTTVESGWKIRRKGDQPQDWPKSTWEWLAATVAYVSVKHDLAVLRVAEPHSLTPSYRTRIATVSSLEERLVLGAGFPMGFRFRNRKSNRLTVPTGELQDDQGPTLIFNVDPASQPRNPGADWQGFSGSVIAHRDVRDHGDLWIYGVAQEVPKNFDKKIEVARLADALSDQKLRGVLSGPKLEKLTPLDPCDLPAAKEYPDIRRLRDYATERLTGPSVVDLMETRATFCSSLSELDRLHRGGISPTQTFTPQELVEKCRPGCALLIKAPGGFGKTFYLLRTMLEAIDNGMVPFFIDLQGAKLILDDTVDEAACAQLFAKHSQRAVKWDTLRKARDEQLAIFVAVDGLNEALTPDGIERTLAYLLNEFSDRLMLIVTDRMSERPPQFSAQLSTILPLPSGTVTDRLRKLNVRRVGDGLRYLLPIPFFLALYEQIARGSSAAKSLPRFQTRSEMLFAYFAFCLTENPGRKMQGAGKSIVAKLAPIAFEAYRCGGIRMNKDWLSGKLQKAEIELARLLSSGLLINQPPTTDLAFSHQLFHDFLVGYHLATKDEFGTDDSSAPSWSSAGFDIATLKAQSFDALDFAVELLPDRADAFLIEVYDWNYQAAIHLILGLTPDDTTPEVDKASALRDALIAINCEKQFDPFQHTRDAAIRRATSIAEVHQSPFNDEGITSRDALLKLVCEHYTYPDDYYRTWKRAFLITRAALPADWALLQASPLIAWTAANSFRRSLQHDDPLISYLLGLYDALFGRHPLDDSAIGVRWRVVHILGAADSPEIIQKLYEAVEREAPARQTQWVQYGAVRSLVEIATRRPEAKLAEEILEKLVTMMGETIAVDSRAFGELRNVAIPACTPPFWSGSYSAVIEKGIKLAGTQEHRELWTKRFVDLKTLSPPAVGEAPP